MSIGVYGKILLDHSPNTFIFFNLLKVEHTSTYYVVLSGFTASAYNNIYKVYIDTYLVYTTLRPTERRFMLIVQKVDKKDKREKKREMFPQQYWNIGYSEQYSIVPLT
jgi:hypothetical protein